MGGVTDRSVIGQTSPDRPETAHASGKIFCLAGKAQTLSMLWNAEPTIAGRIARPPSGRCFDALSLGIPRRGTLMQARWSRLGATMKADDTQNLSWVRVGGLPETDPVATGRGSHRVQRGGSWASAAENVRETYRFPSPHGCRGVDLGFRLAGGQVSAPR